MRSILLALLTTLPAIAHAACPLPGESPMLLITLYFGESIPHRAPLTAAEWANFAARTLTPNFPDGFTVTDGAGQWEDPATHQITREPSKIFTVAAAPAPDLAAKITAITQAYDKTFDQQSVGITTEPICGAF